MYKKYVSGFLIAVILAPYTAFAGTFDPVITFNGGSDITINVEGGASITDVATALGSTTFTAVDDDAEEMTAATSNFYEPMDGSSISNPTPTNVALTAGSVNFSDLLPSDAFPLVTGVYTFNVTVSDSALATDTQKITIIVNTTPVISTNGDSTSPLIIDLNEDEMFTATSTMSDADGHITSFTGITGADAGFFSFDTNTGVLTSNNTFNFENPQDAGGNGIYRVIVNGVDQYGKTASQIVRVRILDVANEPVISGTTSASAVENSTGTVLSFTATDPQDQEVTFRLDGTDYDSAFFRLIDPTATSTTYGISVEFLSTPDYELPSDVNGDNVYNPVLIASDSDGNETALEMGITVTPVNDNTPEFTQLGGTASSTKTILDNDRVVTQLVAIDADIPADTLTYSISGGDDAGLFQIVNATKRLRFITLPTVGVYHVSVQVSDGTNIDTQDIEVTVLDSTVNYAPVIVNYGGATTTLTFDEGYTGIIENINATDLNGDTRFWSISGPDFTHFSITSNNGRLQLLAALDYENPVDTDTDNVYEVLVSVSDYLTQAVNPLSDSQTYFIEVTDVEERPDVSTTTLSVQEGTAPGSTWVLTGTDPQGDYDSATQATTTDAGYFTVTIDNDVDTIRIDTNQSFDYENPLDENGDNIYELAFTLLDLAGNTREVLVTVEVTNENEFYPEITTGEHEIGYKPKVLRVTLEEGETFVYDLEATDGDSDPLTWSLDERFEDGAFFDVATSTGVLEFTITTLFNAPQDQNTDNVYEVLVEVTDGTDYDYVQVLVSIIEDRPTSSGGGGGGRRNLSNNNDDEDEDETAIVLDTNGDGNADTEINSPVFEQSPDGSVVTTAQVTVTNPDGTTTTGDVEFVTTVDEDGEAATTLADPSQAAFIFGAGVNGLTWVALAISLMVGAYLLYLRLFGTAPIAPVVPPPVSPTPPVTPPQSTTPPPTKKP